MIYGVELIKRMVLWDVTQCSLIIYLSNISEATSAPIFRNINANFHDLGQITFKEENSNVERKHCTQKLS
jgi:hypothetical protein